MKFLADENVYSSTVQFLKELGHDVEDARGLGISGSTDDRVLGTAKRTRRILITLDKDFVDIRYLSKKNPSIIVLRVRPPTSRNINSTLEKFLKKITPDQIKNAIVILEENTYRIRKLS